MHQIIILYRIKIYYENRNEIRVCTVHTTNESEYIHLIWIRVFNICYLSWQLLCIAQRSMSVRACVC